MINYSNFNKENIINTTKKNYHIKYAAEKYNNIYKKLINLNE